MVKPNPPCISCKNRQIGCHSTCELYSKFLSDSAEYKKLIIDAKKQDDFGKFLVNCRKIRIANYYKAHGKKE